MTDVQTTPDLLARVRDGDLTPGDLDALLLLAELRVHQVQPGSVVVLRGADLAPEAQEALAANLGELVGHRQFVLMSLPDPDTKLDVVHDPEAVANLLGLARPYLLERAEAELTATRRYLAEHPADPWPTPEDEAADDPWHGTPGLSDAD